MTRYDCEKEGHVIRVYEEKPYCIHCERFIGRYLGTFEEEKERINKAGAERGEPFIIHGFRYVREQVSK